MKKIDGQVQWGIIGAGDVCEKKSGPAFNKVPDSKLVAVMRRNLKKAKDYAHRHGVPKYYKSVEELMEDPEVNAIYIATPPAFHEEYALAVMKAGMPVYIEKPVTLDAFACERLITASFDLKMPVSVAHYRRRLPLFLKLKELIASGKIGKINLISIRILQPAKDKIIAKTEENWRVNSVISGGGIFHDLAPHQLDILCWLFGKPVEFSGKSLNQGKRYNAPDVTKLDAIFEGDIFLNGLWSFNVNESNLEDSCEIFGENGKISFSFFLNHELVIETKSTIETLELTNPEHVQQPLIADVTQFFKGQTPNPSPLEEALWSMKMMDATM